MITFRNCSVNLQPCLKKAIRSKYFSAESNLDRNIFCILNEFVYCKSMTCVNIVPLFGICFEQHVKMLGLSPVKIYNVFINVK